jgi:hypothetical protein
MCGLDRGGHSAGARVVPIVLLLQEDGHDNGPKRPWARHHDTGLDVELGAIEEPIKDRMILFRQGMFKRCPSAALIFNELAERRQGLGHTLNPPCLLACKARRLSADSRQRRGDHKLAPPGAGRGEAAKG